MRTLIVVERHAGISEEGQEVIVGMFVHAAQRIHRVGLLGPGSHLRPANYTALGFAPPHDAGPRSETGLPVTLQICPTPWK
jgi:hypothetical protein